MPARPSGGGVEGHDPADERIVAVAVGVDDHHVAGPAVVEGAQDREVVAAAGPDRHGGSGERRRAVIGQQPVAAAIAPELVAEQRHRDVLAAVAINSGSAWGR